MATEQIVLQNKEFGNLLDTILLKGFWFSAVEPNLSRVPTYMLGQWMIHIYTPWVKIMGVALFILALIGLIVSIAKKEILLVAFSVLFILVFAVICNNAFPFSLAGYALSHVPLLSQAFRFPFTKLSLLLGLLYSLFAAFGLGAILLFLPQRKLLQKVIPTFCSHPFHIYASCLRGNFFYEKEQLKLPKNIHKFFHTLIRKTHRNALRLSQPQLFGVGTIIRGAMVDQDFYGMESSSQLSTVHLMYGVRHQKMDTMNYPMPSTPKISKHCFACLINFK